MIYKESDYKGCYNLKAAERELIIRADKRHFGHKINMAKALEITPRTLFDKIESHGLIFES